MERLRFSGLPRNCQVGPAALLPRSHQDSIPPPCCLCKKVNVNHHECASRHSFCAECIPPSDVGRKWCVMCEDYADFTQRSPPPGLLEVMSFSCACSFSGTLPQIREHLLSTASPELCFNQPPGSIRAQDTISRLTREVEQTRRSFREHYAMILEMSEALSEIKIICDVLCGHRQLFCFKATSLRRREPLEQHKVVDGAPLKIQASVVGLEDEPYICISVAGSIIEARNSRWPLRKRIVSSILDLQGNVIASADILTFENGSYTHDSFIDPTQDPSSQGVSFFVSLADILDSYPSDLKYLVLSIRVGNI